MKLWINYNQAKGREYRCRYMGLFYVPMHLTLIICQYSHVKSTAPLAKRNTTEAPACTLRLSSCKARTLHLCSRLHYVYTAWEHTSMYMCTKTYVLWQFSKASGRGCHVSVLPNHFATLVVFLFALRFFSFYIDM